MAVCVPEDFNDILNIINEQVEMKTQTKKRVNKRVLRFICCCLMCLNCPGSYLLIY